MKKVVKMGCLGMAALCISLTAASEKPNIIFIPGADVGYGSVQANNEKCGIPTPNIDRLIEEGMNFTDAHTNTSVCTPTRYGLMLPSRTEKQRDGYA